MAVREEVKVEEDGGVKKESDSGEEEFESMTSMYVSAQPIAVLCGI